MTRFSKFFVVTLTLPVILATGTFAAEEIGKAVAVTVSVTGDRGVLSASSPVHRDERIKTSSSGSGQFMFRDGTKLAVGPNSSLVLDQSIFVGKSSFESFTLNATRGSFRWISGLSKSTAYKINTPYGTLGIRGTAFDIYVGTSTAAVVLLEGSAVFCGNDGVCKPLTRGCDMIRVNRNGVMGETRKPSKTAIGGVRNEDSFPFLVGSQKLNRPFRVGGNCGLSTAARVLEKEKGGNAPSKTKPGGGDPGGGDPGGEEPGGGDPGGGEPGSGYTRGSHQGGVYGGRGGDGEGGQEGGGSEGGGSQGGGYE